MIICCFVQCTGTLASSFCAIQRLLYNCISYSRTEIKKASIYFWRYFYIMKILNSCNRRDSDSNEVGPFHGVVILNIYRMHSFIFFESVD